MTAEAQNQANARRGSGTTTRQMQRAPQGAFFVCPNEAFARQYGRDLARHLGREDLKLVSLSWLEKPHNWRGSNRSIVVDHAVERLSETQFAAFREIISREK